MWFQVLLILVAIGIIGLLMRQKGTAISAFKKTGLVLLAIMMVVTVLFPEVTTVLARLLGIGRGADLLFYAVTASFVVFAVTQYLRNQAVRVTLFSLARRIALQEAAERYDLHPRAPRPDAPGPAA